MRNFRSIKSYINNRDVRLHLTSLNVYYYFSRQLIMHYALRIMHLHLAFPVVPDILDIVIILKHVEHFLHFDGGVLVVELGVGAGYHFQLR